MKNIKYLLTVAFAAVTCSLSAQTITGFGTGDGFTASPNGFTATPSVGAYAISGTEGSDFFGTLPATVTITSFTTKKLQLTGTISANPGSAINIELFDTNGDSAVYKGFWSSFTLNTASTADLAYDSFTGAFNGDVTGFILSTAPGTATITISLDSLSAVSAVAVPEPSTYASLAGVAALGFVAYRRRRVAA